MTTVRKPRNARGDFHVRKIPPDTRREFRRVCDRLGLTIQEAIVILMRSVIARPKVLKKGV